MLTRLYIWAINLFNYEPVYLAIVRRYTDANGSYVGELYKRYNAGPGNTGMYSLIGCSLDSLPLNMTTYSFEYDPGILDLGHDFLAPMAANTLRVGSATPSDNDIVRRVIRDIPRRNIRLDIQNR